jgi:hypothetical protein
MTDARRLLPALPLGPVVAAAAGLAGEQGPGAKSDRVRRRRLAVAGIVALGAAAALLLAASPAHAVTGGCSVASAPLIQPGQTQTSDPNLCPDNNEYWAISLKVGASLSVDIDPAPPSVFVEPYGLGVYGPNVGTIGNFLCQSEGSGASRVSCLIPADGRYVLVSYGAGTLTPVVKTARPQKGRVLGACDPVNTPAAADGITQYANANVCQPAGSTQYWSMTLHRGDILNATSLAMPSSGNSEPFNLELYGPSPSSLGSQLCGNTGFGPAYSVRCAIATTGRYVLAASNSGSFTALVIHPTRTDVARPALVQRSGVIGVRATVRSDVPQPTGTCFFQEQSGRRWVSVAHVGTTTGLCTYELRAAHPGTLLVRVWFKGAKGWASSTSKPLVVDVVG